MYTRAQKALKSCVALSLDLVGMEDDGFAVGPAAVELIDGDELVGVCIQI